MLIMSGSNNCVSVDGVAYKAEEESDYCKDCAFMYDANNCDAIRGSHGCEGIIWIKQEVQSEKEPPVKSSYTLVEITEAYIEFIDNYNGSKELPEFIKDYFERKMQPEYREYLRLKQKYENYEQE